MKAVDVVMPVLAWLLRAAAVAAAAGLALGLFVGLMGLLAPLRITAAGRGLSLAEDGAPWPEGRWHWEIRWLWGLLRWTGVKEPGKAPVSRLHMLGMTGSVPLGGEGRRGRARRARRGETLSRPRRRAWGWSDLRALWPELGPLVRRLRRSFALEGEGDLVYGFEDPAVTGWCEALRALVPLPQGLSLTPAFSGPQLAGHASVRLTLFPWRGAAAITGFLLRPRVRRWWWQKLRQRVRRRKGGPRQAPAGQKLTVSRQGGI